MGNTAEKKPKKDKKDKKQSKKSKSQDSVDVEMTDPVSVKEVKDKDKEKKKKRKRDDDEQNETATATAATAAAVDEDQPASHKKQKKSKDEKKDKKSSKSSSRRKAPSSPSKDQKKKKKDKKLGRKDAESSSDDDDEEEEEALPSASISYATAMKKLKESSNAMQDDRPEISAAIRSIIQSTTQMLVQAQDQGDEHRKRHIFGFVMMVVAAVDYMNRNKEEDDESSDASSSSSEEEPEPEPSPKPKSKSKKEKKQKEKEKEPEPAKKVPATTAAPPHAAAAATANVAERWNVGGLEGDSSRKSKFLRLLGAKKSNAEIAAAAVPANVGQGSSSRTRVDINKASKDLEQQFEAGVRMKYEMGGQKRGLGA